MNTRKSKKQKEQDEDLLFLEGVIVGALFNPTQFLSKMDNLLKFQSDMLRVLQGKEPIHYKGEEHKENEL